METEDYGVNAEAAGDAGVRAADDIREFWDVDAATYDSSPSHYPQRPQEQAAWAATLRRRSGGASSLRSLSVAAGGWGRPS